MFQANLCLRWTGGPVFPSVFSSRSADLQIWQVFFDGTRIGFSVEKRLPAPAAGRIAQIFGIDLLIANYGSFLSAEDCFFLSVTR